MMKNAVLPIALILVPGLVACGGETPTAPPRPLPAVAGTWGVQWLVQFERTRDGFSGSYYCWGTMTLSQSATAGESATLSGFTVIQSGCPQGTFDVGGSVRPDGAMTLTTAGPRPSEGQCPFADAARYAGQVSNNVYSGRAEESVSCPGPGEGEHRFNYVMTAYKTVN